MRSEIVFPSLILLALLGASSGAVFTWNGPSNAELTLASSWSCTTGPCTPANYTSEASDIVRINTCSSNTLKLTNLNPVMWPTLLLNVSCPTTLNMDGDTSLSVYGVNVQSPLSLLNLNASNMFSYSVVTLEVRNNAAPPLQLNTLAVPVGIVVMKAYSGTNITQIGPSPTRIAFRNYRGSIDITNANFVPPSLLGLVELGSWSNFTTAINFWGNISFSGPANSAFRFIVQASYSRVGIVFKPSSSVTVSNQLTFNVPPLRHYIQGAFNINNTNVILGGFSRWTIDSTAVVKGIGAVNNITIPHPTELGGQFQQILFYFNNTDLVINTTGTFQACRIKLESNVAAITFDRKVATGPMIISEINIGDAIVTLANGTFSFGSVIKGAGRFELINARLSIGEVCGNGDCSLTETTTTCPQDCNPTCGDRVCAFVSENTQNCYNDCSCGDDVCDDEIESCFWCSDCSCSFDGFRVRAYRARARNVDLSLSYVNDTAFSSKTLAFPTAFSTASPVYVVYDSYLQVNATQHYFFKFEAANVALTFKINGAKILSFPSNPAGQSTAKVVLQQEYIHHLVVELSGYTSAAKTASMSWKREADADFVEFTDSFYSFNIPNDRIWTVAAEFDTIDHATFVGDDVCGDGLCLERYPEHCFMDCYTEITTRCSPIAVPPGHISAGLPVRDDTFGNLIRNQMLWHLPGMEHMSYGFNLVHAEQALNPIFYFGYCDEKRLSTVQDTYRGNVYTVPEELFAQPLPKCTFSVDSQTYASAAKMAESYAQDISIEVEASVGVNVGLYKGDGSIAFSGERSVKTASELEQKTEGSIVVSEVKCATSRVKLAKHTFHPAFLTDIRKAKTESDLVNLIKKYGTHVYSSAILGGKLRQVTTLKKEFQSSKTKQELEESAALSLSASVSGPAFSASGSFSGSVDTSTSSESQSSYEKSSFRSSVITYGGPPGSFGPTTSDAPSNFGDWASAIDLLPVPIDYTLQPIYDIIPEQWKMTFDGEETSVRDLWARADALHAGGFTKRRDGPLSKKHVLWWFWNPINPVPTYTFEVSLWQYGPAYDDPLVLRPRDQSPGAPSGLNFNAPNVPKPMPYTFYTDQTVNYLQPTSYFRVSTSPATKYNETVAGFTHIYYNERASEFYLHDWDTGVGRYFNNYDGVVVDDRLPTILIHEHKLISENIGTYHMNIELAYVSGPALTQANFEISLVGKNDTLRDSLTPWDNGLVQQTGVTMTIRFFWKNRPKIGEITEVEMRLSGKTAVIEDNKSVYTIKNLWLQVPTCDTAVFNQTSCANTVNWKVFHSLPNRAHEINNFDAEPLSIYVKPLESFKRF